MKDLAQLLIKWYQVNKRDLPWRNTKDPYKIWLSEIILQQTQVVQGLSYYNKFIEHYPDVKLLAKASEDEVLKLWQGLGYYSRARNLHTTAKFISKEHKGVFPNTFEEILKLKGVGTYTASAIASIAYDLPHAVVDGNVYRVLSRVFNIDIPIDSTQGKKYFQELADELIPAKDPATFNQAIMEFGARWCRPVNPDCSNCILKNKCEAFAARKVDQLPVKEKKMKIRNRYFHYFIFTHKKNIYIRKRSEKDIWEGLYEFYLLERKKKENAVSILESPELKKIVSKKNVSVKNVSDIYKHVLSHQHLYAVFYHLDLKEELPPGTLKKVKLSELKRYALPRLLEKHISTYELFK